MFTVRTKVTSLGTPNARDALAFFNAMRDAGDDPVVVTVGGKNLQPATLERWAASLPRTRVRPPESR